MSPDAEPEPEPETKLRKRRARGAPKKEKPMRVRKGRPVTPLVPRIDDPPPAQR